MIMRRRVQCVRTEACYIFSGKIAASGAVDGALKITGGTGKFKGIQGQGSFQCTTLNDKGQYSCAQQFDYSLTTAANR
jgi:hypothetical protein